MKKIFLLLIGSLLAALPIYADDNNLNKSNGLFIGVEGGYILNYTYLDTILKDQTNRHKYNGYIVDEYDDYDDDVFDYGVKIGWYFKNSDMKAYVEYKKSTAAKDYNCYGDFSDKISKVLLGYDVAFAKAGDFRFIGGGTLGYANMKLKIKNHTSLPNHSVSYDGLDVGGKVGVIYDINPHNELELGLRGSYSFYQEKTVGERKIYPKTYDVNIRPYQLNFRLYLGYNFKF